MGKFPCKAVQAVSLGYGAGGALVLGTANIRVGASSL